RPQPRERPPLRRLHPLGRGPTGGRRAVLHHTAEPRRGAAGGCAQLRGVRLHRLRCRRSGRAARRGAAALATGGRLTTALGSVRRLWRYDRSLLLSYVFVAAFLGLFVLAPLVRVFLAPTASDWQQVLATPRWRGAALNTLTMMALSTASALLIGTLYAYAIAKARVPGSRLFGIVPLLLLITPPFVSGLAFILLLGRRGLLTYQLLGLETSIYGWHGLWLAQTLSFFPIAYLVLYGVFQAIDPSLEQAARGLGAGRWQVLRTVTLPLATPGLLAAGLFIAIGVLGDFGNPMLV